MHQAKGELKLLKQLTAKPIKLLGIHPKKKLSFLNSVGFFVRLTVKILPRVNQQGPCTAPCAGARDGYLQSL